MNVSTLSRRTLHSLPSFTSRSLNRTMAIRPAPGSITKQAATTILSPRDPNTLSNYNAWRTRHTVAEFKVDFAQKRLAGNIHLTLEKLGEGESRIVLDTSHLDISHVRIEGEEAPWELAARRIEPYGSPLTIQVTQKQLDAASPHLKVQIGVSTTQDCTALQWLTPVQTSNKKHPYMFSQCQAIHARSLFPCQDTPDVKSTFSFNIRSPLPVLASGLPTGSRDFVHGKHGEPGTLLYTFHQSIPMPSYLFAIASGDLASASIGPRSTVWTGPEELKASQWEFEADTEAYIQSAEKIVYPYAWTTYNVLVLPPSFPYGGMENPVFTFATPTVVSGDRQNIDVIAHELSHSWSGNLVSCGSWEHFWLNEGWTTYLERRIQADIHGGDKHRDFSAIIGWKALEDSIEQFGTDHEFTKLVPNLKGQDPDDCFSSVPYEKGSCFLYRLEKLVGKEKWDKYIPYYFSTWQQRSVDSYEFKANLLQFFESDKQASSKLNDLDWDTAFYKPGLPEKPDFNTELADMCYALADKWEALSNGKADFTPCKDDIEHFTANQSVVFLEKVQTFSTPLSTKLVEHMGEIYDFASSKNVELVSRYFVVGLQARASSVYEPTATLLGQVGRMKFVRPLYRELMKCDLDLARRTFEKNKDFYHPICKGMVEKLFDKHSTGA